MKLNEPTVFFGTLAVVYIGIGIHMISIDSPLTAVLCLFIVVLCGVIIKMGSDSDSH